jgi:O-acetyl-ADP-ribose deacetylase (regulator of RNase III)
MIDFRNGDILKTQAEALVNTVNCVGIMGRGVALQFKNAFPANFKAYEGACAADEVRPGRMFVFETGFVSDPKYIINFPTKRHWRGKSRIEDIEAGLLDLVEVIRARGIRTIAIPPLGSGLGGLNWADVRERIEAALGALPNVDVMVFEPHTSSSSTSVTIRAKAPTMTAGRAALVGLMRRYLGGLLDPFVTLLELHKLMYFMQEAGEPLRLRFKAAPYGPYAENLRHVLQEIEGYFVSGYADGGDAPGKELTLVPGAVDDAEEFLARHAETHSRFDRVASLVQGFESPFGLELLSTVHWVATRTPARTPAEITAAVYAWGDRKKQFSTRQIGLALGVLTNRDWLPTDRASS